MNRINKENNFLVIWLMCVLILIGACNLSFFKETWSAFGNVTGQLTIPCTINYYSNYPDDLGLDEVVKTEYVKGQSYTIMENVFDAFGYEFVSWNSAANGTGESYNSGDNISLEISLNFYAQWKKTEDTVISYGDVNLDSFINEDDYLSIEQSISLGNELTGQGLLNADVNVDGKVDLVDVDIIKQVCLGTAGYVGILPNNPILVYEIYNDEKVEENDEENKNENNTENNNGSSSSLGGSGAGSSSGSSSGSGSSSTGNSGSGTSNKPSSNKGNKPSSNKGNKPSSGSNSGSNKNEEVIDKENDIKDKNELSEENKEDNITKEDNSDKENNYLDNNESNNNRNEKGNSIYPIIIVLGICLMSFRLIVSVIKRFNEKEKNNSDKEDF